MVEPSLGHDGIRKVSQSRSQRLSCCCGAGGPSQQFTRLDGAARVVALKAPPGSGKITTDASHTDLRTP